MKHLILILLLFIYCVDPVDTPVDSIPVQFQVVAGSKWVEDSDIKIYNSTALIDHGKLPLSLTADMDEVLTAHFEVYVSNFPLNHPQCDCETLAYNHHRCTEDKVVDGIDWEVAK